jgi:uncharacterized membrane protein YoaT (DUF817 family)
MKDGQSGRGGAPEDGAPKERHPKDSSVLLNPVFWALTLSVALSLAVFKRYYANEELPDEGLFRLLAILRYSSFFACVCSLYLVIASAARLVKRPGAWPVLKMLLFLFAALYGAGVVVFTYIITAIAAGNN